MVEKNNVLDTSIKHKGFFNFTELYNFCYNWFKDNKYNLFEEEYTEKLQANGKEIVIRWSAKKKVSDYFKEVISLRWHILGLIETEVQVGDKKEKTNKGEVKLSIKADLEKDYEENWSKTPFYKFLRGTYEKYIIRNTIDLYEDRLQDKATEFCEDVKTFLNLSGKK
ncbi:MAG: hypothetical protein QW103_01290 [Candidatus Pacearchaeota archaeon]